MKVLHIISGGDTGGAKTHVISLVKELDKLIDVKIICFMDGVFYREALEAGIDIEIFKQEGRVDLSVIRKLVEEIEDKNYNIVHCHGARANFIGALIKGKIEVPLITTVHSDYKLDFKDNIYKRIVYTGLNKIALKRFDYYMAVSDSFKSMLISRGFEKDDIFIIYNGLDMEGPVNTLSREEFLNRYGVQGEDKLVIGIMGRLDLVKDHETFIKGAAQALESRKDLVFLIAGTGNDEDRLKKLVEDMNLEDYIHFIGFVEDIYSFFNGIDVNVLTSLSESFPYVLLEGARLKRPAISTRVGGIDRLIENAVSGYLIDVGDWQALAKNILSLVDNKERIEEMGENLYQTLELNFSAKKMAEEHCNIYKRILYTGGREHENNR